MVVQLFEGCDVQQNFWVREMIGRKVDGLGWRSFWSRTYHHPIGHLQALYTSYALSCRKIFM
jgi:hypothetical protein